MRIRRTVRPSVVPPSASSSATTSLLSVASATNMNILKNQSINCSKNGSSDGTVRCKVKCIKPSPPHSGFTFRPNRLKFDVDDHLIIQCHNKVTITAKCTTDGSWSRGLPFCPEPLGSSCPIITPDMFPDGHFNISVPIEADVEGSNATFPLRSKINFSCPDGFDLRGAKTIVCDTGFKWSFKVPICREPDYISDKRTSGHQLQIIIASIVVTAILTLVISLYLLFRWKTRVDQRKRWQRYFGNYTYRSSKTNITRNASQLNSVRRSARTAQEMKLFKQTISNPVPITDL